MKNKKNRVFQLSIVSWVLLFPFSVIGADINLDITAPYVRAGTPAPYGAVEILAPDRLDRVRAVSPGDALDSATGIDMQRRGAGRVQSDISIRGSSSQQNLVLLDGIRINDPQTSHHNLNVPISAGDIERIEISRGPYSSVYGPDAFAGVVNFVTGRPHKDRVSAGLSLAEFGTWSAAGSCDRRWGDFGQKISMEKSASGGYGAGTDFETASMFSKSSWFFNGSGLDLSLGYLEKDFGAGHFYSAVTRDERERTLTRFVSASLPGYGTDAFQISPKVYFRRHDDRFSYRYNSRAYLNEHRTGVGGGEVDFRARLSGNVETSFGGDHEAEDLQSSNLGSHSSSRNAVFARLKAVLPWELDLDGGVRADRHSRWGWQESGDIRLGYPVSRRFGVWGRVGRAFRSPSFTELYYSDPGNISDPLLRPEKNWAYEAGADHYLNESLSLRSSVYRRDESNLIDWVRAAAWDPWRVRNIGKVRVWGFEGSFEGLSEKSQVSLKYAYIRKESGADYLSKYAMRYARQRVDLDLGRLLTGGLRISMRLSAVKRKAESGYAVADAEVRKRLGDMEFSAGLENVLDARYEEIPGVMRPPRTLTISSLYRFM